MAALIERKYRSVRFKAIIAWGETAGRIVKGMRHGLGNPPLILVDVNTLSGARLVEPDKGDLIVSLQVDYKESLREALRLSGAERIVVIGDTQSPVASGRYQGFRASLEALSLTIPVDYVLDQPLDVLTEQMATLPSRSMIFYLLTFTDGRGGQITPFNAAKRVAEKANAPIFSAWESLMGSGIVGGRVLSHVAMGQEVGRAIRAIERGETPTLSGNLTRVIYDWTQLERWGLTGRMLPDDATVLNRPPDPFELYRGQILTAGAVILVLALLSVFLALAVRARNSAMAALSRERAILAQRVQERTAELARSNAELEQFAYAASHDLRQPLRTITSYLTLAMRDLGSKLDADTAEYMAFVVGGARRMDAMIVGLLEYSRVGKKDEVPQPVHLGEVVAEALSDLETAIKEAGADVRVAPDMPMISGHRRELVRLFQNLIGNAVKYVPPDRKPVVSVTWSADGDGSVVSVADNGIGIARDQRERVFGMFQRLVTQDRYEGTGLGLALCRKIVHHHGGSIGIEDNPDGGSVFQLKFAKTLPPQSGACALPAPA